MPDLKSICRAGAAISALLLAGCLTRNSINSDVQQTREARYQGWVNHQTTGPEAQLKPISGALSLDDSILTALGNSRQIQIALLDRERASARVMEAWSEALPTAAVGATYTRLDEAPSFGSGASAVTVGAKDNYTLNGVVTQPLFRGGSIQAGLRAASLYSVLVDEQLRGTYQQVIYNVRRAYYDARLAFELQQSSAEAVRVAQAHLEDVRKNFNAGTLSSFDVLRSEVELKNLQATLVQDENHYHIALTTLYNLIGVSQESTVVLSTPLTYTPFQPDMNTAVEQAFMLQTSLLQGELTVRLYREALTNARADYWPQLNAFFNDTYSKPDPHDQTIQDWGNQWSAGLAATYTIFHGFNTVARVRVAKVDLQQSEISLFDTEQRVLLQVQQAMLSLDDAARFVASQEANVGQAKEALRLAQLGFDQGIRKQVEVDDARNALTSAQANLAQAHYNHLVAKLDFELATGEITPPGAPGESPLPAPASQPAD